MLTDRICDFIDIYMRYSDDLRTRQLEEYSEVFGDHEKILPKEMEKYHKKN